MSYRLVSYRDLYKDDLPKVIRPFMAKKVLTEAFSLSKTAIIGLNEFVSPFGNKEMQQKKLIRDIEEGRVVLLAMMAEFGTLGQMGTTGSSGLFSYHIERVKLYGKERPTVGAPTTNNESEPEKPVEPFVLPERIAEEKQPLIEFLCGWTEVKRNQSKKELFLELLPGEFQAEKRALLERHNGHLPDSVRRGEMVVLLTRDPETEEEATSLNELKKEAAIGTQALHSLTEEQANTLVRQLPLLDYLAEPKFYQDVSTISGSLFAGMETHLKRMNSLVEEVNKLFVDEVLGMGATRYLSETFYSTRKQLFSQLDNVFYKMTFKWLKIPVYNKLKNTLGLSGKSVAYHGKEILTSEGVLPSLYKRMQILSKWIRNSKGLGRAAVALDMLASVPVVVEAFRIEKGDPVKTTVEEAGRITGGYIGGKAGLTAGVAVATLVLGSVGGVPLAIGIALCAVVGGFMGASKGSEYGKDFFSWAYQCAEDAIDQFSDSGGFFDWNAEQI